MTIGGKRIKFEKITPSTFEVFYGNERIGIAVDSKYSTKFYAIPEWKYPIYEGAYKTDVVSSFIIKNLI